MPSTVERYALETNQNPGPITRWVQDTIARSGDPDTMTRVLDAFMSDPGNWVEINQDTEQYRVSMAYGQPLIPVTATTYLAIREALGTADPAPSALELRPMSARVEPAPEPAAEAGVFTLPADLF